MYSITASVAQKHYLSDKMQLKGFLKLSAGNLNKSMQKTNVAISYGQNS